MKKILTILVTVFFTITLNAQVTYEQLWLETEKHEVNQLPKSALQLAEKVYAKAAKEKNDGQLIKALIYRSKFALQLEEDAQLSIIKDFKEHISKSVAPTKNVLENMMARFYWQYFNRHRYKIYNRTKTASKVDTVDFRTWDLETLFNEINNHYQASLKDTDILQKTGLKQFYPILEVQKGASVYRPSLYDFLAHNALTFYKTSENGITKPSNSFEINEANYMAPSEKFIDINISKSANFSLTFNALRIYQDLLRFHSKSTDKRPLIHIDLERLAFVKKYATFKDIEHYFLETLEASATKYSDKASSGLYRFEIAILYSEQADRYSQGDTTAFRFKNKEALKICNSVIKEYPKSIGALKCKVLKNNILQTSITITAEEYIPTQSNSRLFVQYKNIDSLYFSMYKISQNELYKFNKTQHLKKKNTLINTLEKVTDWNVKLRNEQDYLEHTTEVIVPKLDGGRYLILASESKNNDTENGYGTTSIQVTNISLIENTFNNRNNYQVVDRMTGAGIENAKLTLQNTSLRSRNNITKKLVTDQNGMASFKSNNNFSNVEISITSNNDRATFGSRYIYKNSKKTTRRFSKDNFIIKPFIFTDRSIYRPGQKVYFKAIVLKTFQSNSELFTDEYIEVSLKDVNDQVVKTLDLKLNEYGTVAGTFELPNNGLTGGYSIEVDESYEHDSRFYMNASYEFGYNETTLQVEEYKRPTFKTEFSPIAKSYQLNDSVNIEGIATSFSGASISDAKVMYRVHRKVQYPSRGSWKNNSYSSDAQEIAHGEITTDAKGNFKISFLAVPDKSVSKEDLPIFNYEITVDVTDINGETRSTSTIVKVGYHSLISEMTFPEELNRDSVSHTIKINTKNLNGTFVAAKGSITIYKLKAPKSPLRKRVWVAPDYQDIPEKTFKKLFPNEPYTNFEDNNIRWEKGKISFKSSFDTSKEKEVVFNTFKNWELGNYIIVMETEDSYGQSVKEEKRMNLLSSSENKVADNQLFFINTHKNNYQPNEQVALRIGTASKNMTVTVQIEKQHRIVATHIVHLNNEIKTIYIPVEMEDIGGFAIKYHFVNYNYFESGNMIINVPEQREFLQIETNIFRDLLQPGNKETWSFSIKDDKNNIVSSEVLASMYDASLDEFKKHAWSFNPKPFIKSYYSYRQSNAYHSFGTTNFSIKNNKRNYNNYPSISTNRYNWFGFDFTNDYWKNRRYLRQLRKKIAQKRTVFDGKISGVVEDQEGALPGVNVSIKGTTYGTQTDFDGNFSLNIKKGDVLIFSFLGYETLEVEIGNKHTIDVLLKESNVLLDEIVVVGYGTSSEEYEEIEEEDVAFMIAGKASGIQINENTGNSSSVSIKGLTSSSSTNKPLYVIDGKVTESLTIDPSEIAHIEVLKDSDATSLYGIKAVNGVIIITTKSGQALLDKQLSAVKSRTNLDETAFFFPQLRTDTQGKVSFTFDTPEALTRWKLQLLGHTKDLKVATKTLTAITQKELMVVPNAPRFLRQGDSLTLSAKISNLSNNKLKGIAKLILTNGMTGKEIDQEMNNLKNTKPFTVDKDGNTQISWRLTVPKTVEAVQYKIVAKAGDFSDGEQHVLPVLTNRMLVTETLPMWIGSNQTKTFTLEKLKNNNSSTLKNHSLTLEITSNPVWYALQALPYLMEYPYECAEQTFSKYYANTLASHVANQNPKIQEVFNSWKNSEALVSNLEKNERLKSLIIQETPWLRDAQSESEQKKRIGLLFDMNTMKNNQTKTFQKLKDIQKNSGGFPWFKGGRYESNFITQHIASGFGHLKKLGVLKLDKSTEKMISKAVRYLDKEMLQNYENLLTKASEIKENTSTTKEAIKNYNDYLKKNNLTYFIIQYLYMRSFYPHISMNDSIKKAYNFYKNQTVTYWNEFNLYAKGQIALSLFRSNKKDLALQILASLKETSISSDEFGMYWKNNMAGYYYYQSPIETHALLIEVFSELENDTKTIDQLKMWLLKNKQTNRWSTTKATTEAIYALLLQGSDWLSVTEMPSIKIGNNNIELDSEEHKSSVEIGTGYFKTSWSGKEIMPEMSEVVISKKGKGIAWGGLYWEYFEDLENISFRKIAFKTQEETIFKNND